MFVCFVPSVGFFFFLLPSFTTFLCFVPSVGFLSLYLYVSSLCLSSCVFLFCSS
jgi:hypothetical protein